MQVPSLMTDLMEFKDEIFKKIRLLEKKIMDEIKLKYTQLNENNLQLENKLTFLNENTDSLLEFITTQKLNSEKVTELEKTTNKAEQSITMHDMKIKVLSFEIDKIKSKYDKIFEESLQVPGYVGPGCQYKTISDYILNNIQEFSKMKNDRDQMKIENIEVKNRLDNILKSTLNLLDSNILRCQNYTDNKHENMKNLLQIKLNEVSEKNMDIRAQISKFELQNEKEIEKIKTNVEKLLTMKNEIATSIGQNMEEINNRIILLAEDVEIMKNRKEEKNAKTKKNDNNNNSSNENIYINTTKKSNYKLQKIPINQNTNVEQSSNPNNNNNNCELKIPKNKEEKKQNISEDDYSSQNFEKIIPKNLKNYEEYCNSKDEINQDRIEEKKIINNIKKNYKNKNINEKINEIIKMNEFSPNIIQQIEKIEDINIKKNINKQIKNNINDSMNNSFNNDINNINNINNNYESQNIKESALLFKNNKKIKTEKIKIESLEKQKILQSNSLQNIKPLTNNKEEKDKEKEKENNINESKKLKTLFAGKTFSKINIINRANIIKNKNNNKVSITPRNGLLEKNIKNNTVIHNKEQNKIMKEIKTFYNDKKEKNEQKSQENVVSCNIINLNLEKPLVKANRNESANNLTNSIDKKIINNLSEIGMKVNHAFGRTTYSFYTKNELNRSSLNDNNENEYNKKTKNKTLRDKLNIAFVSSIQRKINLNDKGFN